MKQRRLSYLLYLVRFKVFPFLINLQMTAGERVLLFEVYSTLSQQAFASAL